MNLLQMFFPRYFLHMQCNAIFKEVVKQTATVEKLKSGLPKYDKEIQECEVKTYTMVQSNPALRTPA